MREQISMAVEDGLLISNLVFFTKNGLVCINFKFLVSEILFYNKENNKHFRMGSIRNEVWMVQMAASTDINPEVHLFHQIYSFHIRR